MNRMMGMKKNRDVIHVCEVTMEEVNAFEEDTGSGPSLSPMEPYFATPMVNSWNMELLDQFMTYVWEHYELTEEETEYLEEKFMDRLKSLKRNAGRDVQHIETRVRAQNKNQRPNSRRWTVSSEKPARVMTY